MKSSETWSIGQLAQRVGRPTHVLRHWEAMGLLRPARDAGGRRRYGSDDLSRVAVIVRGKEAGIGLDELKGILDADPDTRLELLRAHHAELDRRIEAIRASRRLTRHALECEARDFTACPHFQTLARKAIGQEV